MKEINLNRSKQLARIYRHSEVFNLDSSTKKMVIQALLSTLFETGEEKPVLVQEAPSSEQLGLELRRLVQMGADWHTLGPIAIRYFESLPLPETAAHLVELAFLHGAKTDVEKMIARLNSRGTAFYFQIHQAVRKKILLHFWTNAKLGPLELPLLRERENKNLTDLEKFFVFWNLLGSKNPLVPYQYFCHHRQELKQAVLEHGNSLNISLNKFYFSVGKISLDAGYDDEARLLFSQIEMTSPEYDEAIALLPLLKVDKKKTKKGNYSEQLTTEKDWPGRVQLLGRFLSTTRNLGGFKDRHYLDLNQILKNVPGYFPENPEAWRALSNLIASHLDLRGIVSNIESWFFENATKYLSTSLDLSLWDGPLSTVQAHVQEGVLDNPHRQYWRGVGLLHRFVCSDQHDEEDLWQAKKLVKRSRKYCSALYLDWQTLVESAHRHVIKTKEISENIRMDMAAQLKVTSDDHLKPQDMDTYLNKISSPPRTVLAEVLAVCRKKGFQRQEIGTLLKAAHQTHLTNDNLNNIWQCACKLKDFDLAWRTSTILAARRALSAQVKHSWEISGEKRREYSLQIIDESSLDCCLVGLEPRMNKLLRSLVKLGHRLPELLATLDSGARVTKRPFPHPKSIEYRIRQTLNKLSWLNTSTGLQRYSFSYDGILPMDGGMPAFIRLLPQNTWSLLLCSISDVFGFNAWGWKFSYLNAQLDNLVPKLATRHSLIRTPASRVAKWLKALSLDQRNAWYELTTQLGKLSDEEVLESLAKISCRLSLLIVQNHFEALQSLQMMRAPATIIWDLETWILSDQYSNWRKTLKSATNVPVPSSLMGLPTIFTTAPDSPVLAD